MAQSISKKLFVMVGANVAGLKKSLGEANHHIHEFAHKAGEGFSFVKEHALELAAGLLGVGFSVEHFKAVAEAIDKTAKTGDQLGLTTEALIGFRHGASLAGVGAEEFDGAFTTMIKNVGLAEVGLGRGRKAFERLGIDAAKLGKLTPENQFKVLAEYISKVEDPTTRLTVAMQIFGDQGRQMLSFLESGAAGIEGMQSETVALGNSLSRVDAAKVELALDALTNVKAVITGIEQDLVVALAPVVKELADEFIEWSKSGKSWKEIIGNAVEVVGHGIGYVLDLIDYGKIAWEGLRIAGQLALAALTYPVYGLALAITKLIDLAAEYLPQSVIDGAHKATASLSAMIDENAKTIEASKKQIEDIWTGQSHADKFDAWLLNAKKKSQAAAEEIAKNKPQPVPFNSKMVEDVKAAEKLLDLTEKIKHVNFSPNTLIRAGTAQAQAQPFEARWDAMQGQLKRQIELQNKQLEELKKIDKNTMDQAPDESDVVYA